METLLRGIYFRKSDNKKIIFFKFRAFSNFNSPTLMEERTLNITGFCTLLFNKALQIALVSGIFLLLGCQKQTGTPDVDEDQFAKHIRTTEALSPAEEKAAFTLPPGFEIQLFAAEPDIGKPMNMSFDTKGRMWLTQSNEYPFPDTTGRGKDKITILEDTNGDGQADKFTVFADSLNIPIGIATVPDGAIAYSIPHIYHFIDSDGDDQVDQRNILFSGFQYKDTHGMINNMVRSWDGWIHADHGFANTSTVAGTDGDTIVMTSGNTFRFRMDGSRIEFTTTGRVNPYGYAYDEWGYTYSVDCHSSPIYQLVRGADYPHFGKKPTGIGFGPALMPHNYGSTALAGLEYYLDNQFPDEFQQSFYLGDVVKSRVYRSTMKMAGTTPVVNWEEDFIVSADPWFRPVDVKLGPDGALYIADFYNRIIGHYEVPLDHPGRDRQRGRIWRIVYKGEKNSKEDRRTDWSTASLAELIDALDHPNLLLRLSLAHQIVDRFGPEATEALLQMVQAPSTTPHQYIQGLWTLYRMDQLSDDLLQQSLEHADETVRVHTLRVLFEYHALSNSMSDLVAGLLQSPNPHIQRQAVMVVAKNPDKTNITALLELQTRVPEEDTHLRYAIKQALRDHFRKPEIMQWGLSQEWPESDASRVAEVMLGVNLPDAGLFLLQHLSQYQASPDTLALYAKHAARFLPKAQLDQLVTTIQSATKQNLDLEYKIYKSIQEGLELVGREMSTIGTTWGTQLATTFLQEKTSAWRIMPNQHNPFHNNPCRLVKKAIGDSNEQIAFLASGPINNSGTQVCTIHSPAFPLPEAFSFYLLGRKNEPRADETPLAPANKIELRLVADDQVIYEKYITEPETEEQVHWSNDQYIGDKAYLTLVDGSAAWGEYIAIGGLAPDMLELPKESPNQLAEKQLFACQIAQDHQVKALTPALTRLLQDRNADVYARAKAAAALLEIDKNSALQEVVKTLKNEQEPMLLKEQLATIISNQPAARTLLFTADLVSDLSYQKQKEITLDFAISAAGITHLLSAVEQSLLSPRLLLEPQVQERLSEHLSTAQKEKLAELTANINPPGEAVAELIQDRLNGYRLGRHSIERGSQVFTQHCAACHQIKGAGGNIGPQLDGIGNWGSRALTEKILDPNRNISKAFQNYSIKLKDGNTRTGLFRREEGELLVFADLAGIDFTVKKEEVLEQKLLPFTLMPDHFGEIIPEEDYYALLAYLLNER